MLIGDHPGKQAQQTRAQHATQAQGLPQHHPPLQRQLILDQLLTARQQGLLMPAEAAGGSQLGQTLQLLDALHTQAIQLLYALGAQVQTGAGHAHRHQQQQRQQQQQQQQRQPRLEQRHQPAHQQDRQQSHRGRRQQAQVERVEGIDVGGQAVEPLRRAQPAQCRAVELRQGAEVAHTQIGKQTEHRVVVEHPLGVTRHRACQGKKADAAARYINIEKHPVARCPEQRGDARGGNKPAG